MKIACLVTQAKSPLPSLGGSFLRPVLRLPAHVTGPARRLLLDGLLDTGSDDTVFEEWVAEAKSVSRRVPRPKSRLAASSQRVTTTPRLPSAQARRKVSRAIRRSPPSARTPTRTAHCANTLPRKCTAGFAGKPAAQSSRECSRMDCGESEPDSNLPLQGVR